MKDFQLNVKCEICSATELITSSEHGKKIHEIINGAFQIDNTLINPYFKLPNKVLSGGKGEPNWEHVALCKLCRDKWENTAKPNLAQTLNDFRTGVN